MPLHVLPLLETNPTLPLLRRALRRLISMMTTTTSRRPSNNNNNKNKSSKTSKTTTATTVKHIKSKRKPSLLAETTAVAVHNSKDAAADLDDASLEQQQHLQMLNVNDTCDLIAALCESILENPDSAFVSSTTAFTTTTTSNVSKNNNNNNMNNNNNSSSSSKKKGPSKMRQLLDLATLHRRCRHHHHHHHDNDDDSNTNNPTASSSGGSGNGDGSCCRCCSSCEYISQLAIVSLLAVFQDILPAYRIRIPTTQEMAIRVSKDTKRLWDYEKQLLHHYQQYLQLLEKTWNEYRDLANKMKKKGNKNSNATAEAAPAPKQQQQQQQQPTTLQTTCMLALCELLKKAYFFNFRSNLLTAVVQNMTCAIPQVRQACCQTIETVFHSDAQGQFALEAARQVAKVLIPKKHTNKVMDDPAISSSSSSITCILQTFLALPLRVHADEAMAAQIMASKRKAKKRKERKNQDTAAAAAAAIEDELRESQAAVDPIVLAKSQAETLQTITLVYFRILKNSTTSSSSSTGDGSSSSSSNKHKNTVMQALLPAALEGLAKFAHLINIDTVMDLLAVLKDLLQDVNTLPLDAALSCVLTAFQTLQGPGKELKIDVKEYILPLYNQLPRLCSDAWRVQNNDSGNTNNNNNQTTTTDLALKCLDLALIQRREYSTVRVAAFFKQMLTVALHTPSHTSVPLLALARQLFLRYPTIQQLVENEQDVITSGEYDPTVQDPEHSNPYATSAWELSLARFHWETAVSQQADGVANLKQLQLPMENPDRLRKQIRQNDDELVINFVRMKKKHPLEPKQQPDEEGAKKRRRQVRFVTPRAGQLCLIQEL